MWLTSETCEWLELDTAKTENVVVDVSGLAHSKAAVVAHVLATVGDCEGFVLVGEVLAALEAAHARLCLWAALHCFAWGLLWAVRVHFLLLWFLRIVWIASGKGQ
jgi:hypothetical protein